MNRIIANDPPSLADCIATDFVSLVQERVAIKDTFSLALAGGQTPQLFYSRLVQEPYRSKIPWDKCWFFWGDERCVPPDHADSNYRMVKETLLDHVPVSPRHVHRMRGEAPPSEAAREYEKNLRELFGPTAAWPEFDLILLGLGPDGHTASLMPGSPALLEPVENRWVEGNVIRSLQTVRITVTLPVLNHARYVWFLVTGSKKKDVLLKAMGSPDLSCPASLVRPDHGGLRWYVDKAAAEKVIAENEQTSGLPPPIK